jgi:hypothetical protein
LKKILPLLLFTAIIALLISGCVETNIPTGTLVLNIIDSGIKANTMEPGLDMITASYDIIGTGPKGANFRKDNVNPGGAVTISKLAAGNWTIKVDAKNADDLIIASGTSTVTVIAGTTVSADVLVRPIPGSIILNITESGVKANVIEPDIDMTTASYDIIGTGPNGVNFRKDNVTPGGAVTINGLAAGDWTIEVNAKNADGNLIASGITMATVTAGTTSSASVTVRPINGTGVLTITVSWPAGIITNPSVTGTLTPLDGFAQNIFFILASDQLSATYQNNALPTGYYTLIIQLKDGSTLKWGALAAVRIVNGQTSACAYNLTAIQ